MWHENNDVYGKPLPQKYKKKSKFTATETLSKASLEFII